MHPSALKGNKAKPNLLDALFVVYAEVIMPSISHCNQGEKSKHSNTLTFKKSED